MENEKPRVVKIHDVKIDCDYAQWLNEIKSRYRSAQIKAAVKVNYVAQPVVYDGRNILVIWVPGGDNRPYKAPAGLGKDALKQGRRYYIRKGSVTCIADADDERRLLALTNKIPFDDRICHQAEVSDLNKLLIADFLDEVGSELTEEQIVNMSLEELCWTMQIVGGTTEYVRPKNVGILFFSKDPEKYIPGARIEIVRFGKEASEVFEEKILHGPIHKQLEEALSYLENQVVVEKVKKQPGKALALRAKNYPYEALEEVVCNAVYHKSWDDRNPIEINIYQDRITVYNIEEPVPPLTNEDLKKEHVICRNYRNRRIGDLLKELDLTEGRNTGFPKIYREIRRNGSPLPQFETDERNMHFMATFPIHPIFLEEDGEIVAKDFPKDYTKELSDRQRIILDLIAGDCTLTSQKIFYATIRVHEAFEDEELFVACNQLATNASEYVKELIFILNTQHLSKQELQLATRLATKSRQYFERVAFKPAQALGLIESVAGDPVHSPKTVYQLTKLGLALHEKFLKGHLCCGKSCTFALKKRSWNTTKV